MIGSRIDVRTRLLRGLGVFALAAGSAAAQKIPPTLTVDSGAAAALARRQPRERPDTVRAYPIKRLGRGAYAVLGDTGQGS